MNWIKTFPGEPNFDLFDTLPTKLYPENSPRFQLGFDPVDVYLSGCYVLKINGDTVGRFALYENPFLFFKGEKAASIGSYECIEDIEVATEVLDYAVELSREKGYKYLIGPMEGATWNNYRFTDDFKEGPFFMEPYHKSYYPEQFQNNGFEVIAQYFSNLDDKLYYDDREINQMQDQFTEAGLTIRNLHLNELKSELTRIAAFCNTAFADNFLFTPISLDAFLNKYMNLKDYFDPTLFLIVENDQNDIVGLFFPIKDFNDETGKRFILKTMARSKALPLSGMVRFLGQKTIKKAIEYGFSEVIHAFILKTNVSVEISGKFMGKPYKTYSLYGKKL